MEQGPSRLVVASDQVIPAQCEEVTIARLESLLGVENGPVEPSPEAHPPEGSFIARTLVRDCREVYVRLLDANRQEQKLRKASLQSHWCPPFDVEQPQVRDPTPKLQDVIAEAGQT
jgi:hypothetical protein